MQINLSTRQLRAFMALAREKNFTRAATASHLSQPAFSAMIRQLEEALAVRLFDRTTRTVSLTREGSEFAVAAQRVIDEAEAALIAMSDSVALRKGRVSIALLPSLAADWLPDVLAGFRSAHPGIETQVADVLSEPCIAAVRSGRADFALAATRADTPELRAERFCSDDFYLVCKLGHPLLLLKAVRPKDVAAWPFIHLSRTSSVRQYIDAATNPRMFTSVLEVDQLATVSGMVRAGLGISIVPALTLYQFRAPDLVTRPVRWKGLTRNIYIVQRKEQTLSIAAQAFKTWVLAHPPMTGSHGRT
jgi:LysR family transcriptional regulator, carnitine catabolism transcriptional activator